MKFRPFLSTIFFKMHNPEGAGAFEVEPFQDESEVQANDKGAESNESHEDGKSVKQAQNAQRRVAQENSSEMTAVESADGILIRTTATNNPGDIEKVRRQLKNLLESAE